MEQPLESSGAGQKDDGRRIQEQAELRMKDVEKARWEEEGTRRPRRALTFSISILRL